MAGSFIQELRRRNVFRVAAIYLIVSWLLMQIGDVMFPALRLPEWMLAELKLLANKRDVPYQSLIKVFLAERLEEELERQES